MKTTDEHPHTTRAMQCVALAEFLRVPTSEIGAESKCWFNHSVNTYFVSDGPEDSILELIFLGRSLGFNIWRLE